MTEKKYETERLFWLDSAKGLGILLVVLGHIWEKDTMASEVIYSFHVPFFFIISGMLLKISGTEERDWGTIIKSRLLRLIVPYLFFEIVFVGIYALKNHLDFSGFDGAVWSGLLLSPQNTPIWFLAVLLISELFFICLLKLEKRGILAMAAGVICFIGAILLGDRIQGYPAVFARSLMATAFLAMGYFTAEKVRKSNAPFYVLPVLMLEAFVLAVYNEKVGIYKMTYHNPVYFLLCAVSFSYAILFLLKKKQIKVLEIVGRNTIPVLGLHIIVLRILQEILHFNTDTAAGGLAAMAVITVALVVVGEIMRKTVPILIGEKRKK